MTSKLRTLLYLLCACAVLLLVDLVYLASSNNHRSGGGYSVRRGSKDHGSRWASSNNGAAVSGTIAVPINRNSSRNDAYPNLQPYPPPHHLDRLPVKPPNNPAQTRQPDTPHARVQNTYGKMLPNNNAGIRAANNLPLRAAPKSQPHASNLIDNQLAKNLPALAQPPAKGLPAQGVALQAMHSSPLNTKHAESPSQAKPENKAKSSSEYIKPHMNCSVGKSRQRMVNTYGEKFNASLPAFVDEKFAQIPNIFKYPPPFGFANSESLTWRCAIFDIISNWMGLEHKRDNLAPSVFTLLKHLPEKGLPPDLKRKSCLRCVVVGNGGILKRSALGKVIDNYDVVIRMNDAPTKSFERDVGDKTTMRIFYPESAPKKEKDYDGKDWIFLMMAFKNTDLLWLETMAKGKTYTGSTKDFWKRPAIKVPKKASDFRLLNAAIVSEAAFDIIGLNRNDGKMNANVPTTGTVAIMLGIRMCDEVSVAGFSYDMNEPNAPMHYYDSIKMSEMKKSWTHDISLEKNMLRTLVQQGVITDLTGGIR